MNVFNKITLQGLKKNPTRTVVTIIGVILSAALISGVAMLISSLQHYLIDVTIADTGNWHAAFNVPAARIEELIEEPEVDRAFIMQYLGDTLIDIPPDKPPETPKGVYSLSDDIMSEIPINITVGRLPQNGSELIAPEWLRSYYVIGRTYSIPLGTPEPVAATTGPGDQPRWQLLNPAETREYTIVGYYTGSFMNTDSQLFTHMENLGESMLSSDEVFTLVLQMKKPTGTIAFISAHSGFEARANTTLLRSYGLFSRGGVMQAFYMMAVILIAIIMVGSVSLINNAFSISVSERSRQFGILSSVGATKKQLASSVLFEGLIVAAVGIPVGILSGIAGIGVTLYFVGDVITSGTGIKLSLFVSVPAIIFAAVISGLTILISAYIPAARAGRISAIDAIRQAKDIKVNPKKVRGGRLTARLFGLEGTLAMKSFKRNSKRYRSTVFSLFISIVIFISAASFGLYLSQGQQGTMEFSKYNVKYSPAPLFRESEERGTHFDFVGLYDRMRAEPHVTDGLWYLSTSAYVKSPQSIFSRARIENEGMDGDVGSINIAFMEDGAFEEYLGRLGLPLSEFTGASGARVLAVSKQQNLYGANGKIEWLDNFADTGKPLDITLLDWRQIDDDIPGQGDEYPLTITDFVEEMPEFASASGFYSSLDIILPASRLNEFSFLQGNGSYPSFLFVSDDSYATCDSFGALLEDLGQSESYINRYLRNYDASDESNRQTLLVLNVFTYGFTVLISLIAVANVFNTISTGIRLRRRELAMLKSIGLTDRSFGRMMNYECIFYGLKALLYGLPAAGLMTYLIYRAMNQGVDVPFILPLTEIGIAIFSVFAVVFASMLYSTRRLKRENIIDALRDEMT